MTFEIDTVKLYRSIALALCKRASRGCSISRSHHKRGDCVKLAKIASAGFLLRRADADARSLYPVFVRRPVRGLYPVHTSCPSPISSKTRVPCYAKISPTGPKSPSCPLCKPAATKPQQQAQRLRPERRSHSDDCPKRRGSSATWTLLPRRRISTTPEPPNAYVLPRLSALA